MRFPLNQSMERTEFRARLVTLKAGNIGPPLQRRATPSFGRFVGE